MSGTDYEPPNKRVLHLIYLITFLDLCAVGVLFPSLGTYVRSLGCTHFQTGILKSIYAALQIFSGPIIGGWTDVRGRRSVFLITLGLSTSFYFLMGLTNKIWVFFALRFLLGIFKQTQTISKALIADIVGDNKKENTLVYGRSTSFGSLGFVVGPIIGGYLGSLENGFQHICTMTSLMCLINIVFLLPNVQPKRKVTDKQAQPTSTLKIIASELQGTLYDLKHVDWQTHWGAFILKFVFVLSTTLFFTHQADYIATKYGFSKIEIGYFISLVSMIGVISSFCMGPVRKRFYVTDTNGTQRALHGFLIITLCYIGFYASSSIYSLCFWLIPFGICNAVLRIVTLELLFNHCKDFERGSLTGVSDSTMSLGRFASPILAGSLSDYYSADSVILCASFVSCIGSIVAFHLHLKLGKEKYE